MKLAGQKNKLIEKRIVRVGGILLCVIGLLSTALFLNLLFKKPSPLPIESPIPSINKTVIGQGPLSLLPPSTAFLAPFLEQLILIGVNTRPDQNETLVCRLTLRSSGAKQSCSLGETVFFEMNEGKLSFSAKESSTSITPLSLEQSQLFCEVKMAAGRESLALSPSYVFSHSMNEEIFIENLKKGSVWGKDLFLMEWGGEDYREMTKKTKISIGSHVYFLKPGDCLWWNGEIWSPEQSPDETGPIAQLMKVTSSGADFKVWDNNGFCQQTLHLDMQNPIKNLFKIEEVMTAIRPRSPTEITCQLGKRRVIIKEGDWWVRADNRWKPLRTASDLEAFLNHELPGELFIFKKIETSKGKVIVKGQTFDRMRTISDALSLVLQTEKKQPLSPPRAATGSPHLAKQRSRHPIVSQNEGL